MPIGECLIQEKRGKKNIYRPVTEGTGEVATQTKCKRRREKKEETMERQEKKTGRAVIQIVKTIRGERKERKT